MSKVKLRKASRKTLIRELKEMKSQRDRVWRDLLSIAYEAYEREENQC